MPGGPVPAGDVPRVDAPGLFEKPADIKPVRSHGLPERGRLTNIRNGRESAAEIRPVFPVPPGDGIRRISTGEGKLPGHIDIAPAHGDRVDQKAVQTARARVFDAIVCSRAECGPLAAVPLGHVVRVILAGDPEIAADIKAARGMRERRDLAA